MNPKTPDKKTIYIIAAIVVCMVIISFSIFALYISYKGKQSLDDSNNLGIIDGGTVGGGDIGQTFGEPVSDYVLPKKDEKSEPTKSVKRLTATLTQLYSSPVAGIIPRNSKTGLHRARFVSVENGDVIDATAESAKTERILHETFPGVREAIFTNGGSGVIRRNIKENGEIVSAYISLERNEEGNKSVLLPPNISRISEVEEGILFISLNDNGSALTRSDIDGKNPKHIWSSALTGWRISSNSKKTLVYQNPSDGVPGTVLDFNIENGEFSAPFGSVSGLSLLVSKDGKKVLFTRANNGVSLNVFSFDNRFIVPISVQTFAEKCVWSKIDKKTVYCAIPKSIPALPMPDAWHQSRVSFEDSFARIDTEKNKIDIFFDSTNGRQSIDAIDLVLSNDEEFIFFIDKTTRTPWALGLPEFVETEDSL